MTFERYIAVSQPLRASQICTIKRARYILLFLLLTFFVVNAHFLWTFHLIPNVSHCSPLNDQSLFIKYFTWIDSFKYSFCPFTLLITLNILIIKSLLNARSTNKFLQQENNLNNQTSPTRRATYSVSFSSSSTTNNSANTSIHKKRTYPTNNSVSTKFAAHRRVNRRLTTMLLTVSFAFCICSMPISIMQLIDAIYSDIGQRSSKTNAFILFGKIIAEISQYVNHCKLFPTPSFTNYQEQILYCFLAMNFFLYAFTGRIFRHELRLLFRCHRFSFFKSSRRLSQRSKQLMLLRNPSQGVHEHFYSNGKRYTRILIAPRRSSAAFTSNYSENCTYRQSICSVLSASEIPLAAKQRHDSILDDEQDQSLVTCYHKNAQARLSSSTQKTALILVDSPKKNDSK